MQWGWVGGLCSVCTLRPPPRAAGIKESQPMAVGASCYNFVCFLYIKNPPIAWGIRVD